MDRLHAALRVVCCAQSWNDAEYGSVRRSHAADALEDAVDAYEAVEMDLQPDVVEVFRAIGVLSQKPDAERAPDVWTADYEIAEGDL